MFGKKAFFTVLGLLPCLLAFSQCCSPGNPIGGTSNLSIMGKNQLRTISFYRYGYADTYFHSSKKSTIQEIDNASYHYIGLILAYGISKKVNLEWENGYYPSRRQILYLNGDKYSTRGYGVSNGVISVKYNLLKKVNKELELTAGAGLKYPYSVGLQHVKGVQLSPDLQPSTHAFGAVWQSFLYKGFIRNGLHLFLITRFENNFENEVGYQYGSVLHNSFFLSKSLLPKLNGIVQLRHEYKGRDRRNQVPVLFSGGELITISPQISYNPVQKWYISLVHEQPVYRNVNGIQLSLKHSFSLILNRDF
jgi:hypothetical protein